MGDERAELDLVSFESCHAALRRCQVTLRPRPTTLHNPHSIKSVRKSLRFVITLKRIVQITSTRCTLWPRRTHTRRRTCTPHLRHAATTPPLPPGNNAVAPDHHSTLRDDMPRAIGRSAGLQSPPSASAQFAQTADEGARRTRSASAHKPKARKVQVRRWTTKWHGDTHSSADRPHGLSQHRQHCTPHNHFCGPCD